MATVRQMEQHHQAIFAYFGLGFKWHSGERFRKHTWRLIDLLLCCSRFLSRLLVVDPNRICSKVNRLRSKQVYICRREPLIVSQIINGSMESVRECQHQFSDRKWNCPSKNKRSMRKLLSKGKQCVCVTSAISSSPLLSTDTRETGFVHSMTSAAIVHKIASVSFFSLPTPLTSDPFI